MNLQNLIESVVCEYETSAAKIAIPEIKTLLKRIVDKNQNYIAALKNADNPQIIAVRNAAQGRYEMAEAILQALNGDKTLLRILSE